MHSDRDQIQHVNLTDESFSSVLRETPVELSQDVNASEGGVQIGSVLAATWAASLLVVPGISNLSAAEAQPADDFSRLVVQAEPDRSPAISVITASLPPPTLDPTISNISPKSNSKTPALAAAKQPAATVVFPSVSHECLSEDAVTWTGLSFHDIFDGGLNSLAVQVIGRPEGTIGPDGKVTKHYYGHEDPGDKLWNLGFGSYNGTRSGDYQTKTPQQADKKQLEKLSAVYCSLIDDAKSRGIKLTAEATLNFLDLYNQSQLAALGNGSKHDGFLYWFGESARTNHGKPVLHARAQSYIDPKTGKVNAPGLGVGKKWNTMEAVIENQTQRYELVQEGIEFKSSQNSLIAARFTVPAAHTATVARQTPKTMIASTPAVVSVPNGKTQTPDFDTLVSTAASEPPTDKTVLNQFQR